MGQGKGEGSAAATWQKDTIHKDAEAGTGEAESTNCPAPQETGENLRKPRPIRVDLELRVVRNPEMERLLAASVMAPVKARGTGS